MIGLTVYASACGDDNKTVAESLESFLNYLKNTSIFKYSCIPFNPHAAVVIGLVCSYEITPFG